jgi:hypothetical protein
MITRIVEIRDRNTFVPALAILVEDENEAQRYYMRRTGYPTRVETPSGGLAIVILMRMADQKAHSDVYDWNDRTHQNAHYWLQEQVNKHGGHWFFDSMLTDGLVIDVEYILGETTEPKRSERDTT